MRRIKSLVTSFLASLALLVFAFPAIALAAPCNPGAGGNFLSFPTWYKYLEGEDVSGKCTPVVNSPSDAIPVLVAIVEILLRIIGLAAVAFVVYGGFRYITSQGQPDATKSARQTIQNAFIGVVISIIASVGVSFLGRSLT